MPHSPAVTHAADRAGHSETVARGFPGLEVAVNV